MNEVVNVITAVANASGSNDKLAILQRHRNTTGLKEILKFIYNPYCKTGIAAARLNKAMEGWPTGTGALRIYWPEAIEYFSTHQTGTDRDVAMAREFIRTSEVEYGQGGMQLAAAIVTQDLKIGVAVTSLNKVFGKDFIPKTGCMLGTPLGDVGTDRVAWPCIVTEKLDGIRRILVKENGVCRLYSRSGHEDTGLVEIVADAKHLPNNYVYDGELLAAGTFKDNIAWRQATNSIAATAGNRTGLIFNVFDMLPVEEFYNGISKDSALNRKIRLGATFGDEGIQYLTEDWWRIKQAFQVYTEMPHIKVVPILGLAHNLDEVTPIVESIWANHGEGVILNTASGLYEIKRSKNLLKVKYSEERVLTIVDIIEGTGKYEDSMGAVVVEYKGSYVGVGSGWNDQQRQHIWDNPGLYIGRKIEVECFGESTNQQGYVSLNCPIFLRFTDEEHE